MIASYPLSANLNDSMGAYGSMNLINLSFTSPGPLCGDGDYDNNHYSTTPNISGLDETNFEVDVDFNLNTLAYNPIIGASAGYRWLLARPDDSGYLTVSCNNGDAGYTTTTQVSIGNWYNLKFLYSHGHILMFLDGVNILDNCFPALVTDNDYTFMTFTNGRVQNGCIKNLRIYNNPLVQSAVPGTISGGSSPICLGSPISLLSLAGNSGSVIKWQKSLNNGMMLLEIKLLRMQY